MTIEDFYGPFKHLMTPEWIWDIRKLLAEADFPVYALANELLGFRLHTINPSLSSIYGQDTRLADVSVTYVSPNYKEYDQALSVTSCTNSEHGSTADSYLPSLITNMQNFKPKGVTGLHTLGVLWKRPPLTDDESVQQREAASQISWTPYDASGLQFNLLHRDNPGPVSLAYREAEKGKVIVVSLGTPRPKFLTLLASLVELQGNASLVDKVQRDLKNRYEEMERMIQEQRGLEARSRPETNE